MEKMGQMKYEHGEMTSVGCIHNAITSRSICPKIIRFANLSYKVVAK